MATTRVLVTGAFGLIGGAPYNHLQARPEQYEVYALARRRQASDRSPRDRELRVPDERFTLSDLSDLHVLPRAMQGIEVVVHMAADPRSGAPWESILTSNVIGARNVFEAAHLTSVRRVVFASSIMCDWGYLVHKVLYSLIYEGRFDAFDVVSDNKWCWVDLDHSREGLGYVPRDRAEDRLLGDGT